MGCYTHDSIRLSDKNKKKLKKGDKEAYKLINKEEKKFEPSILTLWLSLVQGPLLLNMDM